MREFLKGLDFDSETINSIMAEYGKNVQGLKEEKERLNNELNNLKQNSVDSDNYKEKFEKLSNEIKRKEEEAKAKLEDEELTKTILEVFGDKKFSSNYVKDGLIRDMKSEIAKPENKSKSYKDIFEGLTKDKEGIFENPNKPTEIPSMDSDNYKTENSAEGFVSIIHENQRK